MASQPFVSTRRLTPNRTDNSVMVKKPLKYSSMNRSRSSTGPVSFHGITVLPSGKKCYPCSRSVLLPIARSVPALERTSARPAATLSCMSIERAEAAQL